MKTRTGTHKRVRLVADLNVLVAAAAQNWVRHLPIKFLVVMVRKPRLCHLEGGSQGQVDGRPALQSPLGLRRKSVCPTRVPFCSACGRGARRQGCTYPTSARRRGWSPARATLGGALQRCAAQGKHLPMHVLSKSQRLRRVAHALLLGVLGRGASVFRLLGGLAHLRSLSKMILQLSTQLRLTPS